VDASFRVEPNASKHHLIQVNEGHASRAENHAGNLYAESSTTCSGSKKEMTMNTPYKLTFIIAALVGTLLLTNARAQSLQVPIPKSAAEVSGPVSGTLMTDEYVRTVGRTAYFWGYPIVAKTGH
jgi:hypothetical protein